MTTNTYTKTICVKVMGIAFKISILLSLVGFVFKLIKGSQGQKLGGDVALPEIFKNAIALNSDALFTLAAYTVCIAPFVLAIAMGIGYYAEKRPKDAMLGALLFAVLMLAFIVQR